VLERTDGHKTKHGGVSPSWQGDLPPVGNLLMAADRENCQSKSGSKSMEYPRPKRPRQRYRPNLLLSAYTWVLSPARGCPKRWPLSHPDPESLPQRAQRTRWRFRAGHGGGLGQCLNSADLRPLLHRITHCVGVRAAIRGTFSARRGRESESRSGPKRLRRQLGTSADGPGLCAQIR
jgi:hypothetical protein